MSTAVFWFMFILATAFFVAWLVWVMRYFALLGDFNELKQANRRLSALAHDSEMESRLMQQAVARNTRGRGW